MEKDGISTRSLLIMHWNLGNLCQSLAADDTKMACIDLIQALNLKQKET